MVKLRARKVESIARDIPPTEIFGDESGEVLVVGWGSTRGAIEAAVERKRAEGHRIGSIHLRHLNPLPPDLAEIFARYNTWLVPELNNGQLVRILRDRFLLDFKPLNKIKGLPFRTSEIEHEIDRLLPIAAAVV